MKGLVASLVHLKPEDYPKSTALEITAGRKLYNVVVQDEKVGKDLLQNGRLKKRVTIIPLNKINAFKVSEKVRNRATSLDTICFMILISFINCTENSSSNTARPR